MNRRRSASRQSLRNLVIAVPLALVAAGIAAAGVSGQDDVYVSEALLLIDQPQSVAAASDVGIIVKLNLLRSKYAGLIPTSRISGPVAEDLGVDEGVVRRGAGARFPADALAMRTTGRAGDAELARAIAQGVAEELVRYVDDEQEGDAIPPELRISFEIVEPAVSAARVEPDERRGLVVAAVIGVVAFVIAFAGMQALVRARRPQS